MAFRFPVFVLVLLAGLGLVGYGLFGAEFKLYEKPDPRDDPVNLPDESSFHVGELQLTDWISKERVIRDAWGHLIDLEQEAECFS
ncbi:MAG: hypothetical protein ACYS99_00960 [Planctomycetota bacterium]|jgi:hypothetical protein